MDPGLRVGWREVRNVAYQWEWFGTWREWDVGVVGLGVESTIDKDACGEEKESDEKELCRCQGIHG